PRTYVYSLSLHDALPILFCLKSGGFPQEISHPGMRLFLVFRHFFRYNGNRKSTRKEKRHESGYPKSSAGSGGVYPVTGARETAAGTEEATAGAGEAVTGKTAGEDAVPE